MVAPKTLSVLMTMLLSSAIAKSKSKCDVVRALRAEGVPDSDMRNWLCLVEHESGFVYDIVHHNSPGHGTDYGIFQLNDRLYCDRPNGYSGTTCWRLRTDGCEDTCASFNDSYISNDAHCAVRLKNCDGFSAWYAWRDNCQIDLSTNSAYDFHGC